MNKVRDEHYFMLKYARLNARKYTRQFLSQYRKDCPEQFKTLPDTRRAFMDNQEFRDRVTSNLFWLFRNIHLWDLLSNSDWDSLCDLAMSTAWDWFQVLRGRRAVPIRRLLKWKGEE